MVKLQKGSHRSDEYLRIVKDKLKLAVEQCIEAAGYEFSPETQKLLMKVPVKILFLNTKITFISQAAQFGKSFLENTFADCDKLAQMCRTLQVLNAVRDPKVGLPLSYIQQVFYL